MNNPFADTLHLSVRPSAIHRVLVVALHLFAVAVLVPLAWSRPWLWLVVLIILGVGLVTERGAALRRAASIQRLRWHNEGSWRWQRLDRRWCEGHLVHHFCLGDGLVVLGLRETHRRLGIYHCVLFPDAVSVTGHRHLRARLTVARDPRSARHAPG